MRGSFHPLSLFGNSSPCLNLWWGWYSVGLYDLGNVVNVVRWYEIFVRVLRSSEVTILRLCKGYKRVALVLKLKVLFIVVLIAVLCYKVPLTSCNTSYNGFQ